MRYSVKILPQTKTLLQKSINDPVAIKPKKPLTRKDASLDDISTIITQHNRVTIKAYHDFVRGLQNSLQQGMYSITDFSNLYRQSIDMNMPHAMMAPLDKIYLTNPAMNLIPGIVHRLACSLAIGAIKIDNLELGNRFER